jgi:hypothetical protein
MFIPLSSPATGALLTLTLTFLFCALSSPPTLAQKFIPDPDIDKCSLFVEGQAFYMLGGFTHPDGTGNFMLDLSVPWNASDPVYKELKSGPKIDGHGCGMANTGELFVLSTGTAFVYNLKSNSWTVFEHPNLSTGTRGEFAVTDPETGIIYIKDEYVNLSGDSTMYSVDLRTKTVNTSKVYFPEQAVKGVAWSAFLKSVVVVDLHVSLYTPSEGTKSSKGRSTFLATGPNGDFPTPWCTAPAYGGAIIVFLGIYTDYVDDKLKDTTYVHTLDLNTRTWRKGPLVNARTGDYSCAVSGDHFIVWGGMANGTMTNKVLVFNIKTEKEVSRYIPPPPRPTTTTLQPSQTPTQQTNTISGPSNTSSGDKKHASIIVAVTGCLLAIILGLFV